MFQWNFFSQKYESIEVCQKSVVQLHLTKSPGETEFGFTVEAELAEDFDKDDELRLYVSQVTPGSVAHRSREFVKSLFSLKVTVLVQAVIFKINIWPHKCQLTTIWPRKIKSLSVKKLLI